MTSENAYDILIIGGGPAGLSAAASIVRQDHKTVLFDSQEYRNAKSKHMHTIPTWDHANPADFRAKARADLERYGSVTVQNAKIISLQQREDGLFEATTDSESGDVFVGKKVVLATGVEDIMPDIPGYEECWVSGIFHCLYCHGYEERGVSSSGIIAQGDVSNVVLSLHFARQALRMSDRVTIYTNGNEQLAADLKAALQAAPAPMDVDARGIAKLAKLPSRAQVEVHFTDGTSKTEGFLAHKPNTELRSADLVKQLGLETTPQGTIKVSPPFNQSSVKGVFAAGDCANPMSTVTAAIYSGTCTGGGAPLQIQAEEFGQKAIF